MVTRRVLSFIGAALGIGAYGLGVRRDVTLDNLRHAYPAWSESEVRKVARASFGNLGRVFLEMLYLRYARRQSILSGLTYTNLEAFDHAEHALKGSIVLSGHLANWEWLALATGLHLNVPLLIVVKNQRTGVVENFLNTMRRRFGNGLVNAGDVRGIYRAMDRGELIAILGDQAATPDTVRVPFFGREVPTFEGVARLALRSRVPIILLECWRQNGRYLAAMHRIDYDDIVGTGPEAIAELTRRHTALLESIIRKRPELWLWQHKRWKHVATS